MMPTTPAHGHRDPRSRFAAGALLCSLALLAALSARAEVRLSGDARGFTQQERQRLAAGELVMRPTQAERGTASYVGGTSYQVIQAPPRVVWQALVDTSRYPRMLPRVLEARVVDEAPVRNTVFMRQGQAGLLEASYFLNVDYNRLAGDIRFRLDERRPHDLEAAWGFYNIRAYGSEQTLLTYGIMADLGDGLLTNMLRDTVQSWMLKTPWMIKRFVEGSGRWLYDWTPPHKQS